MKILPVVPCRRADRYEESNSRLSQIWWSTEIKII